MTAPDEVAALKLLQGQSPENRTRTAIDFFDTPKFSEERKEDGFDER